ncbi:hypothetical protein [Azonexus sp.]|uniref:hypothetical protein n=1 Tax=Azonexus sp. TaxID=1872668 RepID=UPI0035AE09AC
MRKNGLIYIYEAFAINNSSNESPELDTLVSALQSWGKYLDFYEDVSSEIFVGGEALFCVGTEQMCIASLAGAIHRDNKDALSAVERPVAKDAKSSFFGRLDLWLYMNQHQFHVEGKLARKHMPIDKIETIFVGNGGRGSASSLISVGFRDFQKSTGNWSRVRRKNSAGFFRVMLLMTRVTPVENRGGIDDIKSDIVNIFSGTQEIDVYRNGRTRSEVQGKKPVKDKMSKYDHAGLVMLPHDTRGVGFVAVASVIQRSS